MSGNRPFTLRPAAAGEAAAIRGLVFRSGINPTGLDWRRFVLAVDSRGGMIACGQVKPHRDGSLELASIAVEPAWRKQGAARAVIESLLAAHPGPLYLTCRANLGPFYEEFGFTRLSPGKAPAYFRRVARLYGFIKSLALVREDLLVMVRTPP